MVLFLLFFGVILLGGIFGCVVYIGRLVDWLNIFFERMDVCCVCCV